MSDIIKAWGQVWQVTGRLNRSVDCGFFVDDNPLRYVNSVVDRDLEEGYENVEVYIARTGFLHMRTTRVIDKDEELYVYSGPTFWEPVGEGVTSMKFSEEWGLEPTNETISGVI